MYAPDKIVSNKIKQKLREVQGKICKLTIILGNFNSLLSHLAQTKN